LDDELMAVAVNYSLSKIEVFVDFSTPRVTIYFIKIFKIYKNK